MIASLDIRRGIAVILLDSPPVNALGFALRTAVYEQIGKALGHGEVRGIVLAGSTPRAFSAGADISEFGTPNATAFPSLNDLIERVESAPIPIVAAISGFALGGGMELALGCHARIALTNSNLGLPEINLGLMPGAGGTQRLPRLVGRDVAREFIKAGRPMRAEAAQLAGVVDAVVAGDVIGRAVDWLADQIDSGRTLVPTRERAVPSDAATAESRPHRAAGYTLPLETIDRCIDAAGVLNFDDGIKLERTLFEMLVARPESAALRYAFFAERRAATVDDLKDGATRARDVAVVGIVGAGTMGAGIAICFANAGFDVHVYDTRTDSLERGIASIRDHYSQQVSKAKLSPMDADRRLASIHAVSQINTLAHSDLVVEAVFEDPDVKRSVFEALDAVLRPGAILATNTSTLDVNQLARLTRRERDVIGLHFFSPAAVMKLLEIVRGDQTADDVVVTAMTLARRLGKVGVVAGVCDGFIGNRMWHAYLRQAARLVELGATPAQVDGALERWGFAMGPFRVADLAGLDVGYLIRQAQRRLPGALRWAPWIDQVSESGRVGLKGRRGIYRYDTGGRGGVEDEEVIALIAASRASEGIAAREFSDDEVVRTCTHALIVEGIRLLEEKIAQRASDIDVVFLNGYGFPRHRGGPMFVADSLGLHAVAATLRRHAALDESRFWAPPDLLIELAEQGVELAGFAHASMSLENKPKETA